MTITLIAPYWNCKNAARKKELDMCLQKNIEDLRIDKIILVTEDAEEVNFPEKVTVVRQAERPTFADLLQHAQEGTILLANSDIYFGTGLEHVAKLSDKFALALSRYDLRNGQLIPFHRPDSQDVWILQAPCKSIFGNFKLGIPGCDNRFAHELQKAGYEVVNVCNDIQCIHVHESNVRTYTSATKVDPPYFTLPVRSKNTLARLLK